MSAMCNTDCMCLKILALIMLTYCENRSANFMCTAEKMRYIATEHPNVTYFNPRYIKNASLTSKRYGRSNPLYYVGLYINSLVSADRNVSMRYIATEHPNVTYFNPRYIKNASLTSKRYGRSNPLYYVSLYFNSLVSADRNVSVDFYFYEYLTNVYKRSFVEMHFEICNMIENDPFFGAAMKQGKFTKPCPYPSGEYYLYNMTINPKIIPSNFPFRKGRIYCNITSKDTNDLMAYGHIDMEIKEIHVRKTKG